MSQIDLPKGHLSGLVDAERVLKRVPGIAMTHFTSKDVVRHPLVARIVDAYDKQRNLDCTAWHFPDFNSLCNSSTFRTRQGTALRYPDIL